VLDRRKVKRHLRLPEKIVAELDFLAQSIDLEKTSAFVFFAGADLWTIQTLDVCISATHDTAGTEANFFCGVGVTYSLFHEDHRLGPKIIVPWDYLTLDSESGEHIVYSCLLESVKTQQMYYSGYVRENVTRSHVLQNTTGPRDFSDTFHPREPTYIGKTSQGLAHRALQHIQSAASGSNTRFHLAMRGNDKFLPMLPTFTPVNSYPDSDAAYEAEDELIKFYAVDNHESIFTLNTVKSGDALKELLERHPHLFGKVSREHAEEILTSRKSATSLLWNDPDFAERVICNNPRNLDANTVRNIRFMASLGATRREIQRATGVSDMRIKMLVGKKTYGRIM
jgi:hypothetical protein